MEIEYIFSAGNCRLQKNRGVECEKGGTISIICCHGLPSALNTCFNAPMLLPFEEASAAFTPIGIDVRYILI